MVWEVGIGGKRILQNICAKPRFYEYVVIDITTQLRVRCSEHIFQKYFQYLFQNIYDYINTLLEVFGKTIISDVSVVVYILQKSPYMTHVLIITEQFRFSTMFYCIQIEFRTNKTLFSKYSAIDVERKQMLGQSNGMNDFNRPIFQGKDHPGSHTRLHICVLCLFALCYTFFSLQFCENLYMFALCNTNYCVIILFFTVIFMKCLQYTPTTVELNTVLILNKVISVSNMCQRFVDGIQLI